MMEKVAWKLRRCASKTTKTAAMSRIVAAIGFSVVVGMTLPAIATVASAQQAAAQPRIRFGIQTAQEQVTWQQLLETWKEAEKAGYDSAWVFDHLMPITGGKDDSCLEAWTLLAALAAQTQTIRVGVLVTGNTYRNPALLAKMATTVDHISQGRLNLGLGAAWFEPEHRAFGFPFYTAGERAERLGEALEVITRMWSGDRPSFTGKYYSLHEAPVAPKPVQLPHPPIVVGGQGKKWIMPLVARYANGWNAPIGISPAGVKERVEIIRAECTRIGRSPCDIEVSVFLPLINISNLPLAGAATRLGARAVVSSKVAKNLLAGSAEDIVAQIQHFVDAGATHIIIYLRPPFDIELMRRFAAEVIPAFRK